MQSERPRGRSSFAGESKQEDPPFSRKESLLEKRERQLTQYQVKRRDFKRLCQSILDDPGSSRTGTAVAVAMVSLVIVSVVVLIVKETPNVKSKKLLNEIEVAVNIIFSFEFVFRFLIAESKAAVADVYIFFDFLSVMPFWVDVFIKYRVVFHGGAFVIRDLKISSALRDTLAVFKALRMLRLLKLTRRYDGSIVIVHAFRDSFSALLAPFFFLFVAVVMAGTFLFVLEDGQPTQRHSSKASHFQSPVHTIWFMIVTFLTVGFGDVYPMTVEGKCLTVVAMIIGIFDMAIIYAIVGNNFCRVWDERDKVIFIQKLKEHFVHFSVKREDIEESFRALDKDNSGALDYGEFCEALDQVKLKLSQHRMIALWNAIDYDRKGEVRLEDFVNTIFKEEGGAERLMIDAISKEEADKAAANGEPENGPGSLMDVLYRREGAAYRQGRPRSWLATLLGRHERVLPVSSKSFIVEEEEEEEQEEEEKDNVAQEEPPPPPASEPEEEEATLAMLAKRVRDELRHLEREQSSLRASQDAVASRLADLTNEKRLGKPLRRRRRQSSENNHLRYAAPSAALVAAREVLAAAIELGRNDIAEKLRPHLDTLAADDDDDDDV